MPAVGAVTKNVTSIPPHTSRAKRTSTNSKSLSSTSLRTIISRLQEFNLKPIQEAILKRDILSLNESLSYRSIQAAIKELRAGDSGKLHRCFLNRLTAELQAISKVPYERHQLSAVEMLKICLVAESALEKAVKKVDIVYLRAQEESIARSIVVDGIRKTFVILSKGFGKLQTGGTFKKVTDAVEVSRQAHITARRVVHLVNRADRVFSDREIDFQERYGGVLTWLHYPSKKDPDTMKTSVIEEAYDNDLFLFTAYMSEDKRQKLPLPEMIKVLSDIGKTLVKMHGDNTVHRDIKGKNVLYRKTSHGKVEAKVIDFGHTQNLSPTSRTDKNRKHNYGTVRYSAPEVLEKEPQLTNLLEQRKAEDMYALGCLFYEILYQEPLPWKEEVYKAIKNKSERAEYKNRALIKQKTIPQDMLRSSSASRGNVQQQLVWICAGLLDPNPHTRMQAKEFLRAVHAVIPASS